MSKLQKTAMGRWRKLKNFIACLACTGIFLASLSVSASHAAEALISAAASLTNAFDEMATEFQKINGEIALKTNYAASNPLLRQMMEGAPADVFASADQETMDKAAAAGVIKPETRTNFARNELVLIVPKGSEQLQKLEDLLNAERIAIGEPASVPAGRYARDALTMAGLWDILPHKLIQGANVRQVLDYVARGEVDAGFVYRTDALRQKDRVNIALDVTGHEPVLYPIAVAATGLNPEAGQKFVQFVLSPQGMAILEKHGFSRP